MNKKHQITNYHISHIILILLLSIIDIYEI